MSPRRALRQRLARSLGPLHPPLKAGHDAVFAGAVPRLVARRLRRSDRPAGRTLARAVEGIAGRGLSGEERDWVDRIERRRAHLAAREGTIELHRLFRAPQGSPDQSNYPRLALVASIHRPWGTFLLRLVRELEPASCVELGACVGISGAYQAAGLELNGSGRLVTVEGTIELAALARETFAELGLGRVEVRVGAFDRVLDDALEAAAPIDLAFVDAGKQRRTFEWQLERLLPWLAPGAVVVLDDIHWSRELAAAWRDLRRDPRFELATDLWRVGMVRTAGSA
jgi:predicted O-methyltransferase YrrM